MHQQNHNCALWNFLSEILDLLSQRRQPSSGTVVNITRIIRPQVRNRSEKKIMFYTKIYRNMHKNWQNDHDGSRDKAKFQAKLTKRMVKTG